MKQLRGLFDGQLPRLVMFDLDGTLVDSVPDLAAAVDDMLQQLGRPPAGVERVRQWVGNGALVLVREHDPDTTSTSSEHTSSMSAIRWLSPRLILGQPPGECAHRGPSTRQQTRRRPSSPATP